MKASSALTGSILLAKRELLHLCNAGELRVLTSRVCSDSNDLDRLFAVGISTSPLDVDNSCVVGLEVANFAQRIDKSAVKRDLFVLEALDLRTIAPVKRVDVEALVDLVDSRYRELFVDSIEERWQSWMRRESVRIHRRSFDRLIEWSGQKKMSKVDAADPRIEKLLAASIGQELVEQMEVKDLALKFLSEVKYLAEELGPKVGTLASPFEVMEAWEKLIGYKSKVDSMLDREKIRKSLSRRSGEALTLENLQRGGLLSKLRKRQQSSGEAYGKEVQPIMMSYCLDANYRIIGHVFSVDEFSEAVRVIRKIEKDRAAWLYTLFVASRLEHDVVYLQTTASAASAPTELFPRAIESESIIS